jgi:hypothetical protein
MWVASSATWDRNCNYQPRGAIARDIQAKSGSTSEITTRRIVRHANDSPGLTWKGLPTFQFNNTYGPTGHFWVPVSPEYSRDERAALPHPTKKEKRRAVLPAAPHVCRNIAC